MSFPVIFNRWIRYTYFVKTLAVIFLIVVFISGCTSKAAPPNSNGSVNPAPAVTLLPAAEAAAIVSTPAEELTSGTLTARIFSQSDATVNYVPYYVQGQANHKVVVTVNDAIVTVPANTVFSLPVTLDEGPNLIEVIMSDLDGNEVNFVLTVTYQP